MVEAQVNTGLIDISDTLLGRIQQQPDQTIELLLADEHIGKNRLHMCFVMIEQGWYDQFQEQFLTLPRTREQRERIRRNAMKIRARLNYYYPPDKAAAYMIYLIEKLFPDQAQIAKLLLAQKDPD